MSDFTLYYWPIPFRGQFIRAVLAQAGATWDEASFDQIIALKNADVADQPVPHMAPPVLIDHKADISVAQLPAILMYLGGKYDLLPESTRGKNAADAIVLKLILDGNDVLYEMTRHNGAQMWTPDSWAEFQPRLTRWMTLFEETVVRAKLNDDAWLFGRSSPGLADLVIATLWGTMTEKLPELRPMLNETAPWIAALTDRVMALPKQVKLRRDSDQAFGHEWCSGQIEASLRAVLSES